MVSRVRFTPNCNAVKEYKKSIHDVLTMMDSHSQVSDLDRFYALLGRLRETQGGYRTLAGSTGHDGWPARGVYFFFEPGEFRAGGESLRVVRVGTHAVAKGTNTTLWSRLRTHRGTRKLTGNHRGSVFRKLVGYALINTKRFPPEATVHWGIGNSAPRETRLKERVVEWDVSVYLGAMPFLVLAADDEPGPASLRGYIERNSIGLLSTAGLEADPPSPGWLGHACPAPVVRASGLWNVNHVDEAYDPAFLDRLEALVNANGEPHD